MRSSAMRLSARALALGLVSTLVIGVLGAAAATGTHHAAPKQNNVFPQQQAVPGSGKGIVIGYATSLEAVPIVHVISSGIQAQAKRAGVKLIFCDTGGDLTKALDCAKSMKTQSAQGVLPFHSSPRRHPRSARLGRRGCRCSRSTSRSRRVRRRSWASTTHTAASWRARRPARR
jgi:ABC-type sugar transport system substrate-binding protein